MNFDLIIPTHLQSFRGSTDLDLTNNLSEVAAPKLEHRQRGQTGLETQLGGILIKL